MVIFHSYVSWPDGKHSEPWAYISPRFLGLILSYNPGHGKVIPAIYGLYHDFTGWIFPLRWLKPNEPAKLNGGLLPGKSSTNGGHASNHYIQQRWNIWINHLLPSCVGANFAFRRVRAFFVRTPTGPSAASGSLQGTMWTWMAGVGVDVLGPQNNGYVKGKKWWCNGDIVA